MGRDTFHQPRVLRAPSNLALNTAREGTATASLGSLLLWAASLGSFSGQPVPGPHHPHSKEFLPYIYSKIYPLSV